MTLFGRDMRSHNPCNKHRILKVHAVLFRSLGGCTSDMERPHRQLGTGLPNGLGGNNTDSLTNIDRSTCSKVTTIALAAHAITCLAGKHCSYRHFLDASFLDLVGNLFGYLFVCIDNDFAGNGMSNRIQGKSADNPFMQRLDNLLAVFDCSVDGAIDCATVVFVDNHVLSDIDKSPR